MGARSALSAHERQTLLTTVAGGMWPQERAWAQGQAASPLCCACGAEHGTVRHLVWRCGANLGVQLGDAPAVLEVAAASPAESLMWSRCLWPDPLGQVPRPLRDGSPQMRGPGVGQPLAGDVYTDGSVLEPLRWQLSRGALASAC